MPSTATGCAATFSERSLGKRPQYYLSESSYYCMVLLCCDAGESRRGAVLLRPYGGRDKIAPLPFGCGRAALGFILTMPDLAATPPRQAPVRR